MKITEIAVNKLNPAPYNPRQMAPAELVKLTRSIAEFGLVDPLIVNKDMTVIGGHQRLAAACAIGLATVPCIILDLDKPREKTLNLALNRISGEFDPARLSLLLADLQTIPGIDFSLSGFDAAALQSLITDTALPAAPSTRVQRKLRPYLRTHVLLSFPPDLFFDLQPHLAAILAIEGVEYEQSSNG